MRFPRILSTLLALPLLAVADASPLRLAEATKPDWRGENGLVFAADSAMLAFEGDGTGAVATVRRAPDAPPTPVALAPDPAHEGHWLLRLTERGWYEIEIAGRDGPGLLALTAAVIGAPISEVWRTNSVFGIWNVNGDPALIRLAGARWNRRMTSFRDVTEADAAKYGDIEMQNAECRMQNAENSSLVTRHPSLAEGVASPYGERDDLRQVGVFSFGMPIWTMDMPEGIKLPSFGNPFYPAKDWNDVARAVAAYARTHALPRDMSIYNEPLAHFKGKPAQIADYARAVRKGLKAADPSFRIGGPGLYSIHIANLSKIEENSLLESLDFLDMHAYVGGTPPEGEFIRKIDMLKEWLSSHDRADMPISLTEFGWTAADGTWQPPVDRATQARYVARSLALAWSRGINALIYFALDYRTKKAGEAAFSLIGPDGRPEAGYCAFAAVSRHFAASEPIGHLMLAPGVHMVVGRRDGRLQFMVWCEDGTKPCEVALPFKFSAVRDLFGSPISSGGPIMASPSPIFLETEVMATPALGALPTRTVMALPQPRDGEVFAVKGLDSSAPDGRYAAFTRGEDGKRQLQPYELVSPLSVESVDVRWPMESPLPVAHVALRSNDGVKAQSVRIGLDAGKARDVALEPMERRTLDFALPNYATGDQCRLFVEMPDGSRRTRVFDPLVLPVFPRKGAGSEHARSSVYARCWKDFGGIYNSSDGAGGIWLEHDNAGLYLEVAVQDFEHFQTKVLEDPSRMWEQDSVQLGIDMDALKPWEAGFAGAETSQTLGGHRVFEFTFGADGKGGCKAYLERSWDDSLPAGTVRDRIRVETDMLPNGILWRYRIFIPWAELGAAGNNPKTGGAIGIALAVNDIDPKQNAPRHGWTLFGGIVDDKDPKLFGRAWLR